MTEELTKVEAPLSPSLHFDYVGGEFESFKFQHCLKIVDWFSNFAWLFLVIVDLLPSLSKENFLLLGKTKFVCLTFCLIVIWSCY